MLCSVKDVKALSTVSENVDDKYITSAIWEAQEFKLKTILGYRLLKKLKELINSRTLDDYPEYEHLANLCNNFLSYQATANLCLSVSFKLTNAGVVNTPDEKVVNVSMKDISVIQGRYQGYADARIIDIQNYLCDNRTMFPELNQNTKHEQKPNLQTAENCGIFLGGRRGK